MPPYPKPTRTHYFAVQLCFAIFTISHPVAAEKSEPPGFRGIPWRSPPSAITDRVFVEANRYGDEFYGKRSEKLSIGPAELQNIAYVFYRGEFFRVLASWHGEANYDSLITTLKTAYGPPSNQSTGLRRKEALWKWDHVSLFVSHDSLTSQGSLFYDYMPVSEKRKADIQTRAEGAAQDL